ncbi:MAG: hypothetical protein ACXVRJ_09520 [Gaiellaceae bacterium]
MASLALAAAVAAVPATAGPYSKIAAAMVRAAAPSVEAYWYDHHTYVGITVAKLRAYDRNLSSIEIEYAHKNTYCIEASVLGSWYHAARVGSKPTAVVQGATRCPSG